MRTDGRQYAFRKPLREESRNDIPEDIWFCLDHVYVSREKDSYLEGEISGGSYSKSYGYGDLDCIGDSGDNLYDILYNLASELKLDLDLSSNSWDINTENTGICIETDLMVNNDWESPTEKELSSWKQGKADLYIVDVQACISVHRTVPENKAFDYILKAVEQLG